MATGWRASWLVMAAALLMLQQPPGARGNFLNFKPGQEYQYKFTSDTNMKGMDKFSVAAKVGYTNIGDDEDSQEIYLRVPELSLTAGNGRASGNVLEDWDMSKWFSFKLSPRGEVIAVYHDPEEDGHKLAVKKGFAGLLASKLHDSHETDVVKGHPEGWTYDVKELGHEGHHEATYVARLDNEGNHVFIKTRNQHPLENARSNYTKRIEYSRKTGVLHRVKIHEDVNAIEHKEKKVSDKKELSTSEDGEDYANLYLPGMSAMATGHLEFLTVTPQADTPQRPASNLTQTSLHVTKPKTRLRDVDLPKVLDHISSNLTCMRWEPSKGSPKLTNCFRMLRNAIYRLPDEEIDKLAENYLPSNTVTQPYARDRLSILDALSDLDSDFAQKAITNRILLAEKPETNLAERYLLHVAGNDEPPCDHVVSTLESIVFEPEQHQSLLTAPTTYNRATLALGAVTRKLLDQGRKSRAEQLADRLRNLLGMHEHHKKSRERRSAMSEQELQDEDTRRVVLLEALGNVAMPACYKHIESHLNRSSSQWIRRAALHALRHYDHDHAAELMLRTALEDTHATVREDATRQYIVHPKAKNEGIQSLLWETEKEIDSVQSQVGNRSVAAGSGHAHSRSKRSSQNQILDFEVKSPNVDWTKVVGTTDIGASFGVTMKNMLKYKTGLLDTEVELDMYDEAFARVNLGTLGANRDVFQAKLCFKGKAVYDVNMLQEYDPKEMGRLTALYDILKDNATSAIKDSMAAFRTIVDSGTDLGATVKNFVDTLNDLPGKVLHLGDNALSGLQTLGELDAEEMPAFVGPLWRLANKIMSLYGDIQNDVMGFYIRLLRTTITVPFASKQVFQSISDVVDSIQDFNSDPKSAINTVNDNTVEIGLQVQAMIEAMTEAKEAAFFVAKTKPYWWNMKQQKDELNVMAQEAVTALNDAGALWVANVGYDELKSFSEGRKTLTSLRQDVVNSLSSIPTALITPFSDVADLGDDLQKSFTDLNDLVYDIKQAYEDMRVGVNTAQELVNRVFGPRVHRNFPRTFRVPAGICTGNGLYESVMGHGWGEYTRQGIDLTVNVGANVVAPFSGYVTRSRDSDIEVILTVTAGLLNDITIFIKNVNPDSSIMYADDADYEPNHVAAGEVIGVAIRSACTNHIHVSMMKESRGYIDPTSYLEPRTPSVPTWTQECDDYKFVYKTNTVATGLMSGLSGKLDNNTSPARSGATVTNPTSVSSSDNPATTLDQDISNTGSLGYQIRGRGNAAVTAASGTGDSSLEKLMSRASVFLSTMNPKNLKVGSLAVFLNSLNFQSSFDRLNNVFQKIQTMMNYQPCLNPYQMPDDQLRNELRIQGKTTTGTRAELVDRFLARENRCMTMSLGMAPDMACRVDQQCMGIECCLGVKLFMFKKNYRFYTRYDPCTLELVVGVNNNFETRLGPNLDMDDIYGGFKDYTIETGLVEASLNAELMLKMSLEKSDTQITLTASAGFCRQNDVAGVNCLLFLPILDKAIMPLPVCGPAPDRTLTFREVNLKSELRNMRNKFNENSRSTFSTLVDTVVAEAANLVPCMSTDVNSAARLPCPRPDRMTEANLQVALQARNLSSSGTKSQMVARLEQADRECTSANGTVYTIPYENNSTFNNDVYMTISDDCRRFEACVDFSYRNFSMSVRSSLTLDDCTPLLTVGFQECTQELVLFDTNLDSTGQLRLSDYFIVDYKFLENLTLNEYIMDVSLKIQVDQAGTAVVDTMVAPGLRLPIPTCGGSAYELPTSVGTFSNLAGQFGNRLKDDMVTYMFKMLHINNVLTDTCTLGNETVCPYNVSVAPLLPADYQSRVSCITTTGCDGISCCIDWAMGLPDVPYDVIKQVPFEFNFDPCNNMYLRIRFGGYQHTENLLDYEFGTEKLLTIGVGENVTDPAPVQIRYMVSRLFQTQPYDEAFLLKAKLSLTIPIDGVDYSFPAGGLTLMDGMRIEVCPAANLTDLSTFNLTSFTEALGESSSNSLTPGTAQMILNRFGLTQYLKKTQCDISKSPYIPNLRGWRDDCDSSLFNLPTSLGDNAVCHMSSSCTRVDCCFHSPLLGISVNAFFDLNVCDYYITGGVDNRVYGRRYLLNQTEDIDWTTGVNGTFEISNAIYLNYKVRKDDPNFLVDVSFNLCLGDTCQYIVDVYRDTRVPQLNCEAGNSQALQDVSFQVWKWEDCTSPAPSGGCHTPLGGNTSNTCVLTGACKSIHCCLPADLVVAHKDLEFTFTSDVCADTFTFTFEQKTWTKTLSSISGLSASKVPIQESVGEAITLNLGLKETISGLELDATMELCTTTGGTTLCANHTLVDDALLYDPASNCGAGKRRKRRSTTSSNLTRDQQMLNLVDTGATTTQIEAYFTQLEQAEETRCSQLRAAAASTEDLNNPKAILEALGDHNPRYLLTCNDASIVSQNIEGANLVFNQLTRTNNVLGRSGLMYIPGHGLTTAGLEALSYKLANLTLAELNAVIMTFESSEPELVVELLEDMRQLIFGLYSNAIENIQGGGVSDQFTDFDVAFDGSYTLGRTDTTFTSENKYFLVGGLLPMTFSFTNTISYGVDMSMSTNVMDTQASGMVTPYANIMTSGSLAVGVVMEGSLTLSGTIADIRFPSEIEIKANKFPLEADVNMDLDLLPLELKLSADINVNIVHPSETIDKNLFSSNLWYYRAPNIRKRVMEENGKEDDTSSPQFITAENTGSSATIVEVRHCQVRQVPGLDYTDPRVEVLVDVKDDRSKVKLTLDIGTEPGLTDVMAGYEMGGPQIVITERLNPSGVPMHFKVTAENSEGEQTSVTCSLPTYDITLPDGRFTSEFKSTSNGNILKASVVLYEDSRLSSARLAVGLGRNIYSDGVKPYMDVNFTQLTAPTYDASSDTTGDVALSDQFAGQKIGRLIVDVAFVTKTEVNVVSPGACAKLCMQYASASCLSFNYHSRGDCELLAASETATNALSLDGLFRHYERLGTGLANEFNFPLTLTHNTVYYMVLHLVNVLNMENILSTGGALVDLTPPEPGPMIAQSDNLTITDCESNLPLDRRTDWKIWCVGIDTAMANHRTIIDSPGSMTIFNGHEPLVDQLYTSSNTYISANWDGIHDDESGLLGFAFAVGTSICGDDIHPYHDPYKHLTPQDDDSQWSGIGVVELPEGEKLPDGKYYVTIRAINQVEYGGPLVTTICHSTPLAIDNTPPIIYEIYNIKYDDVSYNLTADFNASDPESDIKSIHMCLGLNAINCDLMNWTPTPSLSEIVINHQIPDGQRAWVRLRVLNNVDMQTDGVAQFALIVDNSGPDAGTVWDGEVIGVDLQYSSVTDSFCANWADFQDPQSGIALYQASVVNAAGTLISNITEFSSSDYMACFNFSSGTLQHNTVYKFRLTAVNAGHKQLNTTVESNGVLIDTSSPVTGQLVDGQDAGFTDQVYSTSTSTVSAQWRNFADAQSTIDNYAIKVTRASNLGAGQEVTIMDFDTVDNYTSTVEYHHLSLQHGDLVKSTLRVTNGAQTSVQSVTNGIVVDLTPPVMTQMWDGSGGSDIHYTSTQGSLSARFTFQDAESGIQSYKFQVYQLYQGSRHQFYPSSSNTWSNGNSNSMTSVTLTGFTMTGGALYSIRVASTNNAGAIATYDTDGVIFDSSAPTMGTTVKVGAFSSENEEVISGFVQQSDLTGIKASWTATDGESGVQYYEVAVGTSPGATNTLSWRNVGHRTSAYIDGLSLSVTNTGSGVPTYYVAVRATNGAGMTSSARTSRGVKTVQSDRPGSVTDGPIDTHDLSLAGISDIDFQKDKTTVTAQFNGFTSHLKGVVKYDWAVGTTPGGEEMQPFMTAGIMHDESETGVPGSGIATRGVAHASLALVSGQTYYTTVRAITNDGTVLQSTSNGFTIDDTPPTVAFVSYAQETQLYNIAENEVLYRGQSDTLLADWQFSDATSDLSNLTFRLGSFPGGEDLRSEDAVVATDLLIGEASLPTGVVTPAADGRANILTVVVEDEVGLTGRAVSASLIVDTTAPTQGSITCPAYIQTHNPIECSWEGFHDPESSIVSFQFEVTVGESLNSVHSASLAGTATQYATPNLHGTVKHGYMYLAIVTATNSLGLTSSVTSEPIRIDSTPPVAGTVVEVFNSYNIYFDNSNSTASNNLFSCNTAAECTAIDTVCQESLTSVYVAWSPFLDDETDISRYQIAVGTSAGGGQIKAFFDVPVDTRYYQVKGLNLNGQRQIFVSVKAFNGAGMATVATSNGVYISYISQGITPPSPFSVWDRDSTDGDIDYQTSRTAISARWDVSGDPCPVLKYEWAIERIDGDRVQDYYDTNGQTFGLNDELLLQGVETYYQLLRVTTALNNFTYTLRSDGVTILDQALYPGQVYDGDVTGIDLEFQPFLDKISANWAGFGEKSEIMNNSIQVISGNAGVIKEAKPPNQEIVRYEVAVGTDRRFANTRDDIVAWTDVGLNTSVTFYDLDLDPWTAVYYFTVRAYSTSASMAEVTSNGFNAGYNDGVSGGEILIGDYVNASDSLPLKWQGFQSSVKMMVYYVAISSASVPVIDCDHVIEGGEMLDSDRIVIFDVVDRYNVGENTYTQITGLSLAQDTDYWVSVIGVDEAGKCRILTKQIHIDVTNPIEGALKSGPYFDMSQSFTYFPRAIQINWENYTDAESGIETFKLDLYSNSSCAAGNTDASTLVTTVTLAGTYTDYKFLDVDLSATQPYYVVMTITNRAQLSITTQTPPIVVDTSMGVAGSVADGTDILNDRAYHGSQTDIQGTILYLPSSTVSYCQPQSLLHTDPGWSSLETSVNNDHTGHQLTLVSRDANVQRSTARDDEVTIKLAKDTSSGNMFTGNLFRSADLANGGTYEMDIRAADGGGHAVTSVMFWDGPEEYVTHYDFTALDRTPYCDCCYDTVVSGTCESFCSCSSYRTNNLVSNAGKRRKRQTNQVMQLTSGQRSTMVNSGNVNSITPQASTNPSQPACGMQIYKVSGTTGRLVLWCTFSDTTSYEPRKEELDLEFNPSSGFHHYSIEVYSVADEAVSPTWCMAVSIDRADVAVSLCGLPSLSANTTLQLSVWNWKNYIPTINVNSVFSTLWNAEATFRNMIMPAAKEDVCRYKTPFRGGNHGFVSFEAGIGSDDLLDDIVPFQKVNDPCIPCVDDCNRYQCNSTCVDTTTNPITLTLSGLNLPVNFTDATNTEKPKTYFFTVRGMLGSGVSVKASSDGFNIDTTPPVLDTAQLVYLDTSHDGEIRPATKFYGSNTSMMAGWECTDPESNIVNYEWAIGTSVGGEEVQNYTSVGTLTEATNANLTGLLNDGSTYYVSLRCTNGAGLTSSYQEPTGIIVTMTPPALPGVSVGLVSMSTISANTVPAAARRTSSQTSFSLDFTVSSDPDINEYYLMICSTDTECDDVFKETLISNRQSGRLTISNGRLLKDGNNMFELQQVLPSYDSGNAAAVNSAAFRMEPGRQIFPYIRGCNEAQCSIQSFGSIIFMNGNSQSATSTSGESITTSLHTGSVGRKKRSASGVDVTTPSGLTAGQSIVMTSLTTSDMSTAYASAASSSFTTYLTDPAVTTASSQYLKRILYNRVSYNSGTDDSFALTSVGDLEMPGPLTINYPYNAADLSSTWQILHWNPDSQLWELSHETCEALGISNTYVEDSGSGTITIKVCNTRGNSTYNSTYDYFREETQFLLTDVSDTIPNTSPSLTSSVTNSMDEDGGTLVYQLVSTDAEGDSVTYSLDSSVTFTQLTASVQISSSGLFLFTPDPDEHGDHKSVVLIKEDPIAGITALTSTYTLTITVNSINDAPVAFAFLNGVDLLAADPTEPVEVLLEEKRSGTTDATSYTFIFGAYDQDGSSDTLSIQMSTGLNGSLTDVGNSTSAPTCSSTGIPCATTMTLPHSVGSLKWVYVTYIYVPFTDYWGIDPAQLYVEDANGTLSSVITMNFTVMARPCEHDGTCTVPVNATYTCNNMNRALSFDYFYYCTCASGYEGTYCEVDVDECAATPCVWPYECVDGPNSYTCKCPDSNPDCDGIEGWMIGLFVVLGLLALALIILLWYLLVLRRGRLMWRNLCKKDRYRRDSLDSGRDSPAKTKNDNFNFENKGYIAEKEDEDGFNTLIDRMMSPPPGEDMPPPPAAAPAQAGDSNPFTLFGTGAMSGAAIAAAAPSSTIMAPQSTIKQPPPPLQPPKKKPVKEEPEAPPSPDDSEVFSPTPKPAGMYMPRTKSAASLRKTSISGGLSRKGSTGSWLNSLLNNSDTDVDTPRTSRPITPVEHPAVEEEDSDDNDDHLFFA